MRVKQFSDSKSKSIFMDREDFLKCPFHSLAAMYFDTADVSTKDSFAFPDIPRSAATAKHINDMFRTIKKDLQEDLEENSSVHTSHSMRRGAASELGSNFNISMLWIIQRGK
jgi:hypothetical protein